MGIFYNNANTGWLKRPLVIYRRSVYFNSMNTSAPQRPRGRPPKVARDYPDTREALLRAGVETLTEQGFGATGLDGLLKKVGVPKGSFYHYFASKDAFGREVMQRYARYFADKLDRSLLDDSRPPLERLAAFVESAKTGMARHAFQRGCLVGNLGHELNTLPDDYRELLERILQDWQQRLARCFEEAQQHGQLANHANPQVLAEYFWIGWEGAVMRARLVRNLQPLELFFQNFMAGLPLAPR